MKMKDFLLIMKNLMRDSLSLPLQPDSRLVFISDLHMGDGGKTDDFRHNEELLIASLRDYYLPKGYTLVLNGDIEELHKFKLADIQRRYETLYAIFRQFDQAGRLVKLVGNHDLALLSNPDAGFKIHHSLCLEHPQTRFMAFHGHQAYKLFMQYNYLSDFLVRNVVEPLKLASREKPLTSKRRYHAERRIYRASKKLGLISINGHTHRPLFESYSKYDNLRWQLENLLRKYAGSTDDEREKIESVIKLYAEEFKRLTKEERKSRVSRSLYEREEMLVPCMFNSGCATAKSGYTALELSYETISLAFWTRAGTARPYLEKDSVEQLTLTDSAWKRYIITSDSLQYIIARARLLA